MNSFKAATLAVIAFALTGCARSPESTVEHFYKSVAEGELNEAQNALSQQVVGLLGPQKLNAALAQESERVMKCGGIKSIDVQLEGQGDFRVGNAEITYKGDCPAKREKVNLIKEDGDWKLSANK